MVAYDRHERKEGTKKHHPIGSLAERSNMPGQEKGGKGVRVKQEVDEAVEEDASVDRAHIPRVLIEERLGPQRGRHKRHDQVLKRPACTPPVLDKGPSALDICFSCLQNSSRITVRSKAAQQNVVVKDRA